MIIFTIIGILVVAFIVIDWIIKTGKEENSKKSNLDFRIETKPEKSDFIKSDLKQELDFKKILDALEIQSKSDNSERLLSYYESIINDIAYYLIEVHDKEGFIDQRNYYIESYQTDEASQLDLNYFEAKILAIIIFIYWYKILGGKNETANSI